MVVHEFTLEAIDYKLEETLVQVVVHDTPDGYETFVVMTQYDAETGAESAFTAPLSVLEDIVTQLRRH